MKISTAVAIQWLISNKTCIIWSQTSETDRNRNKEKKYTYPISNNKTVNVFYG